MSIGAYVPFGGVARKVTKTYIVIGGVARKVIAGYVVIGGVARKWWPWPDPYPLGSSWLLTGPAQCSVGSSICVTLPTAGTFQIQYAVDIYLHFSPIGQATGQYNVTGTGTFYAPANASVCMVTTGLPQIIPSRITNINVTVNGSVVGSLTYTAPTNAVACPLGYNLTRIA